MYILASICCTYHAALPRFSKLIGGVLTTQHAGQQCASYAYMSNDRNVFYVAAPSTDLHRLPVWLCHLRINSWEKLKHLRQSAAVLPSLKDRVRAQRPDILHYVTQGRSPLYSRHCITVQLTTKDVVTCFIQSHSPSLFCNSVNFEW